VIVIDAGALVRYLLVRQPWDALARRITASGSLHAPHLLDFEVASALRGLVLGGEVAPDRAATALSALDTLDVVRYPAARLIDRIWHLRGNLTAYDAAYVALAEALDVPLLTTDERLARSTGHTAEILSPA
jgi:predicted nucleic acid-binding protein